MGITTIYKNFLSPFLIFFFLLGIEFSGYSQCPTVSNANQTFCDSQSPTVGSLAATNNGGGVVWYSTATSTAPLSPSTSLVSGQDYFADDATGACGARQSVTVTIVSRPIRLLAATTLCKESVVSDLNAFVLGNNIKWYSDATGGSPLNPLTPITNGAYWASQTNPVTGCETTRNVINVQILIVPSPTGAANQVFCTSSNPTVGNLVAFGTNISWYASQTSGFPLNAATPLVNGQIYFAESFVFPCPSIDRFQVTVSFNLPNNAGTSASRSYCEATIGVQPSINLFNQLTGNPNSGGVWSGPIPTSNGNLGTLDVSTLTSANSPYVFTYTVSSLPCPDASSNVTIVVNPTPTVVVASPPICQGTPATVAATASPAGTYTYAWTVPAGAINPGNVASFTTTTAGVYSVIASNNGTTCVSESAQTTVVINPRPTVTVTSPPVCQGTPTTVTATASPAGTYTYAWTVPAGVTNPGNVAIFTTSTAGVYSLIITNPTTTCPSLPVQTTVVINPIPTVTVTSPPVCQGTSATVTATASPAGTYTYSWTVPSGATNPGNVASFNTTISGVYSVIASNVGTTCISQPSQTTVVINPRPTVTVTSPPVCQGTPAVVTATPLPAGSYIYTWNVPAGATNPGNVATFTTSTAGVYSLIITNPTTTCPSQPAQTTVVINPRPTVTVLSPPVCQGTSATVTATPMPAGTYTYAWTVPAGATNPGNVSTFTATITGIYSVIITNPTTTCLSQPAQTTVVINPIPTVTVTSPPVCQGTPSTVTATPMPAGTYSYSWTVPAGATNPGNVATFTNTTAGVYSVIITNPTTACSSQPAQTTVVINPRPTVTVTSPPVCQGTPATVTATPMPAGAYTYAWTVPAGAANPGNVGTFSTTTAGVYSVIITNPTTTCPSQPAQTTVVFNPVPTVTVTSPPVCQGTPATVTATASPAGTFTYAWAVPAGATNPGNVATFTTTTAGVYSVIITNPTTTCPSQPAQTTVVINPRPTVTLTSPAVCQGTPATVTATPMPAGTYTYAWTVPTGVTNPGNVATFTTTTAGIYSVIITNPTTTCASQQAQTTVVINPVPTVTVTSPPVCQGTPATVTATALPAGTYNYVWTVPAGATNPGNVATFTTSTAGIYSVIISNPTTTCPSQPAQTTVVINPIPTVTVTSPPVCQGTPATVTATASPVGNYNYIWTVPAGATNPGNVAAFTTATEGVYSVIITNPTTTCPSQPAQTTVVINPIPTVTVTSPPVCQGTPAIVTATPMPAGTYTYTWAVPTGATNPGNVATFTTSTAGVYSVIISIPTTTCTSQPAQTTVVINPRPTVTVTSPPVCQGTPATVTATASPAGTYAYAWTVPAGATNPGNIATFTTNTEGVYSVVIANSTATCPSLPAQTTVVVNPIPTVSVASSPVCQGTPATVTATPSPTGNYTYTWTVPAGATNPGNVASFTTMTAGVYSVIASNNGTACVSESTQTTVVINPIPTVTVTSPLVCEGTPATVTATALPAGTYAYAWTVPAGATNPGNVGTVTTSIPGVYSVIITDPTTTCPSQPAQTTVVINPRPTVTVTSPPVCQGTPATVTATASLAGTYTYTWTVPAGATNPGNVATFTTTTEGVYSVDIANPTATCPSLPAQTTVVINPIPTVTVTSPPVCQGTPATVSATPSPTGNYTYTWTVPAGATNPGNVTSFTTTTAGVYSVIASNIATTCISESVQTTVVINPVPTVTVTSPRVCQGTPATVTATALPAGTYAYAWTVPAGATNPGNVATFTTSTAGVYSVIITDPTNTCPSQPAQTTVVINPIPTVTVTSPTVCQGTPATVTATASPAETYTYAWIVPAGAINPGNVSTFTTTTPGVYSVISTNLTTTCPSQPAQTTVVINPIPTVTVTSPPVCQGTPATVTATPAPTGNYTYTWTVPAGVTNPGNVATFTTSIAGIYSVIITNPTTTCPSQPAQTTVVINPIPTVTVTSPPVCQGTPATVTATAMPSGTYTFIWTVPAGATNPGNVATFTSTTAGVYSVIITNPTTICPSQPAETTVIFRPVPDAGSDIAVIICSNEDEVDLFDFLGLTAQPGGTWSPPLTSGTGIFDPAVDPAIAYTYTVSGIFPCTDATATITITIVPGPEAGVSSTLNVCQNSAAQDLFLLLGPNAQPGGTWSPLLTSGTGFFDPSVDSDGEYTYTLVGPNPCDNDEAIVTIIVDPIPDAGSDGSHLFCTNDSPQDLMQYLTGTPQAGGTWFPLLNNGTGVFNPAIDTAGVYTYSVGGINCTPATAQVTVTIIQSPIAGADGQIEACVNDTTVDLVSGLDGTQGMGSFADDNATGALTGTIFNPSLVTAGTYTFTYTVGGGTDPCFTDTSIVTVVVNPLPIAGTFVPAAPICSSAGPFDLNTLLTGQDLGGFWTDFNSQTVNSPLDIVAFAEGTYAYTYNIANDCGTSTQAVSFTILPVPVITNTIVAIAPICIGADAVVNFTGMMDGIYDVNYNLSGANVVANQTVQITVTSGIATFTILGTTIPNSGATIVTFDTIQNTLTNCSATLSDVTVTFEINPAVTIEDGSISVEEVCVNSDASVQIVDAINLPDGVYQFNYTIPTGTPSTGNSGDVIITAGNGQFTIPASVIATAGTYTLELNAILTATGCANPSITTSTSFEVVNPPSAGTFIGSATICPSAGTIDLMTLLNNESTGGVWTDATSTVVTNPLTINSFAAGTYSYTYTVTNACGIDEETVQFIIIDSPTIITSNITIPPSCVGANVDVNLSGLIDGTYTLNYDLSGANVATAQTVSVTIVAGIGSFSIPATVVPIAGSTVITFTSIVNTVSNCTSTLMDITALINIRPLVTIESSNLSAAAVCIGNTVVVAITNATNLPDGLYQFSYTIPNATPAAGTTTDVTITNGSGQFSLLATLFPTAVSYSITVTGITTTSNCANTAINATTVIVINSIPNTNGATVAALETCQNFGSDVTISGAAGLPNGAYTIIYELSGANAAITTVAITVVNGQATFTIPASELTNVGNTIVTITDIMSDTTLCMASGALFTPVTFMVIDLGTPVLIDKGNEFCESDNPTIADLTANIQGNQTVIWYNATSGGTAYNDSVALVNGTTYYAALVNASGCEGVSRLQVIVEIANCNDLIIPDGFSPNNDGINDDFYIVNLDNLYPNFKLEVYNRYGNLLYTGNKDTPRWNGTTSEKSLRLGSNILPSGVYFFIIYFNDGVRNPYQGRVYLNR